MTNYIDYEYYSLTFGGTLIPQTDFIKMSTQASMKVKNVITGKDISQFEDQVKTATCLVAECLYNQAQRKLKMNNVINGSDAIITSEKVGDYSRTLSNVSASELKALVDGADDEINDILNECLLTTGLLYSGMVNVR